MNFGKRISFYSGALLRDFCDPLQPSLSLSIECPMERLIFFLCLPISILLGLFAASAESAGWIREKDVPMLALLLLLFNYWIKWIFALFLSANTPKENKGNAKQYLSAVCASLLMLTYATVYFALRYFVQDF